jgi:large subunit ribosomal protein L40
MAKRKADAPQDPKIINMLKSLALTSPRRIPPPLRMARQRHLRHWTIHRAWLLFRRKERVRREKELMRQWQSIYSACEELRLTEGPGTRDMGYLYRVAMEKKGVYGHHGVPIEYARPQTESPAREAWNHGWKR